MINIIKKLLILLPILSLAHPHLFIDTKLKFIIKKDRIDRVNIIWIFDDINSQIFMMDYDRNKDKKFDNQESQEFKKEYFNKSFIHIKIDGKDIRLSEYINNFKVEYKKNLLLVNFSINFQNIKQKNLIEIGFWDKENYTAFTINEEKIIFQGKKLRTDIDFHYADLFVADLLKIKL